MNNSTKEYKDCGHMESVQVLRLQPRSKAAEEPTLALSTQICFELLPHPLDVEQRWGCAHVWYAHEGCLNSYVL